MAIEIPGWDERFETAQSRKAAAITWTPLRHSFVNLLRALPPEVAAAALQIVFLAAQMPKRGKLHDGGRDLTIEDIERYVGAGSEVVAAATSALGVNYHKKEGRKEGRKRGKEGGEVPPEKASPSPTEPCAPKTERLSQLKPRRARPAPPADAIRVAEALRDAILAHTPDHVCGTNGCAAKWARELDLAIRVDGRTPEQLEAAILFAHGRDYETFWRPNIQSGKKLRAQFETLRAQAARERSSVDANPQTVAALRAWLEDPACGRS